LSVRGVVTVALLHARDLGRRRLALAILIALPLAFYFSAELTPTDPAIEQLLVENPEQAKAAEMWVIASGAIGATWSIAVASLFVVIGARRADHSLQLAGFRPVELLLGRVLTVLGLAAVLAPVFALVIRSQREVDTGMLVAAIALSALMAIAVGVITAALVPREMEGVLVIIGAIGIQMSGDAQSWMPLWGSTEMLRRANGLLDAAATTDATLHSLAYSAALFAAGVSLWARRSRLWPPAELLVESRSE
jgi:hypothetical protein